MSDPNYAPYGVDDDPFLTHPAGAGRAQLRSDQRYGQPHLAAQPAVNRVGAAPSRLPPAPTRAADYRPYPDAQDYGAPQYDARDHSSPLYDDPLYGQFAPAPAGDPWAEQRAEQASYGAGQPQPQLGNFRPRTAHDIQYDQAYSPDHHAGYAPQFTPQYTPEQAEPAPIYRAEPSLNAQRPTAAPNQTAAPRHAAAFAAPPRAPQPHTAHTARAAQPNFAAQSYPSEPNQSAYGEPYASPRSYAPLPQQAAHYAPLPQQAAHNATPPRQAAHYAPLPQQGAYDGYEEAGFAAGLLPNSAKLMQMAGAICTVLAVIGAGYWGYALAVRDAHGIPVVRAQVDPLRIAPETPGGEVSANQGLAVNTIPAAGIAAAAPDHITLAPQVAELTPEDTQIVEGGSFAQTAGAGTDAALAGASDKVLTAPAVAPETTGGLTADLTALPDALPEDMPMTDAEAVERALEAALAEGGDPVPEETAASTLAPAEPASMSSTDPIAPPTAELDPTTVPVGTPMAQLGAFDTADTARAEWANLQTRFTELMAGKALVVEPAKSGGRDFFRLRAHGFASEDDTRRFCAAILAENGSCFPVDQR